MPAVWALWEAHLHAPHAECSSGPAKEDTRLVISSQRTSTYLEPDGFSILDARSRRSKELQKFPQTYTKNPLTALPVVMTALTIRRDL